MIQTLDVLTAISPVDGRYRAQLPDTHFFSEFDLTRHRLVVETEYLLFLADQQLIPAFTRVQQAWLREIVANFSLTDAQEIKTIEEKVHHDVKAIEYWLRRKLVTAGITQEQFVHLALTSEDTNSIAYGLLLQDIQRLHLLPTLHQVLSQLADLTERGADHPMMGRTHGQPAVPTTIGKELANFGMRLLPEIRLLEQFQFAAKLTGAVGNFNAQVIMLSKHDWLAFSHKFLSELGLQPEFFTTQILPAENYIHFFHILHRINTIILDMDQDLWRYISDGYLKQKLVAGQVGSSTMPHKINPIDFENSEGSLGMANAMLEHFAAKLPVSRLQRDLSDSTVKRHFGSALATTWLGYHSLLKGLAKIHLDSVKLEADLDNHPEVLAEAYQVVLRFHGLSDGYEQLQKLTQGQELTLETLHTFLAGLSLPPAIQHKLKQLTPRAYVGLAPQLAHQAVREIRNYLQGTS